jgi:hypothetical protein
VAVKFIGPTVAVPQGTNTERAEREDIPAGFKIKVVINMEKIFEAVQREVDKQQFNFGLQDYQSTGARKPIISKEGMLGAHTIKISFQSTENNTWDNIVLMPYSNALEAPTDYDRRPELIKLAASVINWIDCLDRNNRCVEPDLTIKKFTPDDLMPIGKYKGYKLSAVPPEHLLLALENNFVDGLLKDYIVEHKQYLQDSVV